MDSVEFDLQIDTEPATDGYLWSYQFGFVAGTSGLLGFQGNGWYQSDPAAVVETTKFAFFWISGANLPAELGNDITPPDSRTAQEFQMGVAWTSIHAKFDWQTCKRYRFRLALDGTDDNGDLWYGAWLTDPDDGQRMFLGRMLVPVAWGQLSTSSSMWTNRILGGLANCSVIQPVVGVWSKPLGNDGALEPLSYNTRFETPTKCGSSRFTDFPGAIRQELGVAP
jgi:hypothetical protein